MRGRQELVIVTSSYEKRSSKLHPFIHAATVHLLSFIVACVWRYILAVLSVLNGGINSKVITVVIVLNGKAIVYRLTHITPSIECMVTHLHV